MGDAVAGTHDAAVMLFGRVTYDSFAGAWPEREAAGGEDAAFAKRLGDVRKIVASRSPMTFTWRNSEHGQLEAQVWPTGAGVYADAMNRHPEGGVLVFSKTLAHADWDETRIASGALADDIDQLKREPGGDPRPRRPGVHRLTHPRAPDRRVPTPSSTRS